MTREKAKELAPIIKAYSEGATIEYRTIGTALWHDSKNYELGFHNYLEYRIKPKPKLVPFTFEDELLGRRIIYSDGTRAMITAQKKDGVYIGGSLNLTSYSFLISTTTFEDGSKCGKYIKE